MAGYILPNHTLVIPQLIVHEQILLFIKFIKKYAYEK